MNLPPQSICIFFLQAKHITDPIYFQYHVPHAMFLSLLHVHVHLIVGMHAFNQTLIFSRRVLFLELLRNHCNWVKDALNALAMRMFYLILLCCQLTGIPVNVGCEQAIFLNISFCNSAKKIVILQCSIINYHAYILEEVVQVGYFTDGCIVFFVLCLEN